MPDFNVIGGGTIYLLVPNTDEAKEWIDEHTADDAMWLGDALAVEHRYIADIVHGIQGDGLTVE